MRELLLKDVHAGDRVLYVNARAKFFAVCIGSLACKLYNGFCDVNSEITMLVLLYFWFTVNVTLVLIPVCLGKCFRNRREHSGK